MRWWAYLLVLVLIPTTYAAGYSNWHYAGETFRYEGTLYSVEGFSHDKVLLGVGGTSYLLSIGECKETAFSKYCFAKSAYPDDDAHIKYQGGRELFGYYITVTTLAPTLDVTRTISTNNPKVNEEAVVEVKIKNTASMTLEDINYVEIIPAGVNVVGPGAGYGLVNHSIKTLIPDKTYIFTYTLRAEDYVNANLKPNVTYAYAGQTFNATVAPISFFIVTPLETKSRSTPTLNLDETGEYVLNITNKHETERMTARVALKLPNGLRATKLEGFTERGGLFQAEEELDPKRTMTVRLYYASSISGQYKIPINITGEVDHETFRRFSEESVTTKADKLIPSITLSSTRTTFKPGEQVIILGQLENKNTVTTFKTVSGTLFAPGLVEPTDFSHQQFAPQKTLTEVEQKVVIPQVNETKNFLIEFSGHYTTPGGEAFSYNTTKMITVVPAAEPVSITRTFDPATPLSGGNVTVTVNAKNIFNQYISFTTEELFDGSVVKLGGITYSENSLERNAQKQLYIYQLQLPENTTELNITTLVSVKGEPEQRVTSTLRLAEVKTETPVVNTTAPEVKDTPVIVETKTKEKGFFGQMWDFVKSWFS